MKRVLIISPHFPPVNSADMHRVRQMLPFLPSLGWEAEVITVDPVFIESYSDDPLLLASVPANLTVHRVSALRASVTRKFGLGSLSMRSFLSFRKKGNELLKTRRFDLVFFSTTAFHVMALGPYWKRKFKVPFVLDIQDPWRNDFYLSRPKQERPPKFFIAYSIDKYLEARTVPIADAIISVSRGYCETFMDRYADMRADRCHVLPFGAVQSDMDIMMKQVPGYFSCPFRKDRINVVYVGRGGHDMQYALRIFFNAMLRGRQSAPEIFNQVHCWFIGTSYAVKGAGTKTIEPIAADLGLEDCVTELTDRMPYFHTLYLLKQADVLFVPGSTDTQYTASKIFPYVLAEKPLLACFHQDSSVIEILRRAAIGDVVAFSGAADEQERLIAGTRESLERLILGRNLPVAYDQGGFERYTAGFMTRQVITIFDRIVSAGKPSNRERPVLK